MLYYRTGSRFISYINIDGTEIPCTYFSNKNLTEALLTVIGQRERLF